jgi:hypothetical protein
LPKNMEARVLPTALPVGVAQPVALSGQEMIGITQENLLEWCFWG